MQSWAIYDLARVDEARGALDAFLAASSPSDRAALRTLRGPTRKPSLVHYGRLRRLGAVLRGSLRPVKQAALDPSQSPPAREAADRLAVATDALVAASFGGGLYPRFEEGRHGLWVAFPEQGRAEGFDPSFCSPATGPSPWCAFLGS
jgi:hypothetical protein